MKYHYRGSKLNVLDRTVKAATEYGAAILLGFALTTPSFVLMLDNLMNIINNQNAI